MRVLVVTIPFADYQVGDVIQAGPEAAAILAGPMELHVTVADHPDTPVPEVDE